MVTPAPLTPPAFLTAPPAFPEWPALGQRFMPGVTSYLGRVYSSLFGHRSLTLDLHVPDGEGPFPVAVYASGGGFMMGSTFIGEWRPLLEHGYAVASITYRLRGEAHHPEPTNDIVAAAQWVRAHAAEFGLDASSVVGVGSSAGAYLLDFAALTKDAAGEPWTPGADPLFRAVVSFYAPTDFLALVEDAPEGVPEQPGTPTASESLYLGYAPTERPEDAALAALGAHARADAAPILVLHGEADHRVGVGQARRFAAALVAAEAPVKLVIVPGAEHGDPVFASPEIVETVTAFLAKALA